MIGVKALKRLDQAQRRDLLKILQRHPGAPGKAPGDRVGEREMRPNQPLTSRRIAVLGVRAKVRRVTPVIGLGPCDAARRSQSGRAVMRHPQRPLP